MPEELNTRQKAERGKIVTVFKIILQNGKNNLLSKFYQVMVCFAMLLEKRHELVLHYMQLRSQKGVCLVCEDKQYETSRNQGGYQPEAEREDKKKDLEDYF